MKKFFSLCFVLLASLFLPTNTAHAQSDAPHAGEVLCLPAHSYKPIPGECLLAGPAHATQTMLAQGIRFPLRPFRILPIDPALSLAPYRYMRVSPDANKVPVFASLADAIAGKPVLRYLENNFTYITYADIVQAENGAKFVLTDSGYWLPRGLVSPVAAPKAQGVTFSQNPLRPFGWVLMTTPARTGAGYAYPEDPNTNLLPYQIVQIYETRTIENILWHRISDTHWLEDRLIAQVTPNPTPPSGVINNRWIEVNLYEQTLAVYQNGRMRFATVIASGVPPLWTRPGLFQIYKKLETTPMSGAFEADRSDFYYLENVPWTMYFDEARALHGAYWRARLGYAQSHGCVNLYLGDANWLFQWAQEGDWVYVWDPSGQTPTDPALYNEGGA